MQTVQSWGLLGLRLFAILLAASMLSSAIRHWLGPTALQRLLGGKRPLLGAIKGCALGGITPFCSMSTVPVLAGLLQGQVPTSTVTAFIAASPLIDPMLLVVTATVFGINFAAGLVVAAFLGTILVAWMSRGEHVGKAFRVERIAASVAVAGPQDSFPARWTALPAPDPQQTPPLRQAGRPTARAILTLSANDAWQTLRSLWLPLCLGLIVGALIETFAPRAFLENILGPGNLLAVPLAAVLGVPMSINTATAIPIAIALLHKGASLGSVFALVVGGWGAAAAEVALLASLMRTRTLVRYLFWVFGAAITGGYLINAIH